VNRYSFRVPVLANGEEIALALDIEAAKLADAASKVSCRLGLGHGSVFAGYSRSARAWVAFRVGRSPRSVQRAGRVT
jgi:hypothetical protein